jgi:hypothetical protein
MAKISTYPNDSSVSLGDRLIGTDVDNLDATKNFTIADIFALGTATTFVPYTGATQNVDLGLFNLDCSLLDAQAVQTKTLDVTIGPSNFGSGNINHSGVLNTGFIQCQFGMNLIGGGLGVGFVGFQGNTGDVLLSQGSGSPPTWSTLQLTPEYAHFYHTVTQTVALNTNGLVRFGTTGMTTGCCSVINDGSGNPTIIKFSKVGQYNLQVFLQAYKTSGSTDQEIYYWIAKNGVDVPYSGATQTVKDAQHVVAINANFIVDIVPNDEIQVYWYQTTNIDLAASAMLPISFPSSSINIFML